MEARVAPRCDTRKLSAVLTQRGAMAVEAGHHGDAGEAALSPVRLQDDGNPHGRGNSDAAQRAPQRLGQPVCQGRTVPYQIG